MLQPLFSEIYFNFGKHETKIPHQYCQYKCIFDYFIISCLFIGIMFFRLFHGENKKFFYLSMDQFCGLKMCHGIPMKDSLDLSEFIFYLGKILKRLTMFFVPFITQNIINLFLHRLLFFLGKIIN